MMKKGGKDIDLSLSVFLSHASSLSPLIIIHHSPRIYDICHVSYLCFFLFILVGSSDPDPIYDLNDKTILASETPILTTLVTSFQQLV